MQAQSMLLSRKVGVTCTPYTAWVAWGSWACLGVLHVSQCEAIQLLQAHWWLLRRGLDCSDECWAGLEDRQVA
jgi:hypothetical protein